MQKRYVDGIEIWCAHAHNFENLLNISVKLTNFGFAEPVGLTTNKDDERAAALARRAQQGDYDEGRSFDFLHLTLDCTQADSNQSSSLSNSRAPHLS